MPAAMDSPNPVPVSFVVKNGSNKRFFDFGGNAFAGVRDFKDDDVRLAVGKRFPVPPGAQRDCAVVGDAVGGVLHEIDQHLLDLRGVHPDFALALMIPKRGECWPGQVASPGNAGVSSKTRSAGMVANCGSRWPREMEKVIHNPLQSQDFPFHEFGVGVFRGSGLKVFFAG